MSPLLSLVWSLVLASASTAALARDFETRPTDPPLLGEARLVSQHGLSFRIPGNWKPNGARRHKDGVVTIRATAVNHTFGAINLEIVVHAYPDKLAPSLKQMAEYMIDLEKDGSENYSEATFTPLTLAGHDQVLAARYEHTSFDADRPYRHRLDLYALKACGTRRVCATYAQTLALNEVPAKAVLEMVLESVSYQPGRVVK